MQARTTLLALSIPFQLASVTTGQEVAPSRPFVGRPLTIEYTSTPGNSYYLLAALPPMVALQIPGIAGTLRLNPQSITPVLQGTVPVTGIDHRQVAVPNDPNLIGARLDLQALDVTPTNLVLSDAVEFQFEPAPPRPNVVLIVADDLGYGTLSSYGGSWLQTPNIDSIATNGVRFTDGYVTAGTCSPARAGLLTARYQQRFGFEFNAGALERTIQQSIGLATTETTMADLLRASGYSTGMAGKWHQGVQSQFLPNVRGFDEFYGFLPGAMCYLPCAVRGNPIENSIFWNTTPVQESEYLTDAFARRAVDFIGRHHQDPFFLYLPFNAVHTPLEATNRYLARFLHIADPDTRAYLAMTSALDDAVGTVLTALRQHGLEQDTLVIFVSDNGATRDFQQRIGANLPLRLGKAYLFEGGVRVPMLMQWPAAVSGGTVFREPVHSLDLFSTILAAVGANPPTLPYDGVDLVPHLSGQRSTPPHQALFWRNGRSTLAVRRGRWKLIRSVQGSTWLYDLDNDIGETTNLASQFPSVVQQLEATLINWNSGLQAPAWTTRGSNTVTIDGLPYKVSI